jgi:uncharacterized membrane protein YfhO
VTDAYFPGWKAYLDGVQTKIIRSDYAFRSIFVPAGSHNIEFIYDPKSFTIGKRVSVITVLFLVAIYAYDKHKKISRRSA